MRKNWYAMLVFAAISVVIASCAPATRSSDANIATVRAETQQWEEIQVLIDEATQEPC